MGLGNLARMAQQMQAEMARVQAELEQMRFEGTAGGGAVKATVSGKQEVLTVSIDPGVVDPSEVEMLQDLVTAAVNDALRASVEQAAQKMAAVTGGMRIPGLG
jgi:nucleoid-associated protein EbfC